MSNPNFKKGDQVKILSGKDKGKTGKILEVASGDGRVMVEGVGLVIRHKRPRSSREKGQKLTKPTFIDPSKVMLVCTNCGKPARVSIKISETGEKSRICKNCERAI